MGKHSDPEETGSMGGHVRRGVVERAEVIEAQREGKGLPATPNTVARAATWRMLKLVKDPAAKAEIKAAAKRPHDYDDAAMLLHLWRALAHQAFEDEEIDSERLIVEIGRMQDAARKLNDSERARTAGPSAHGAGGVQVVIINAQADGSEPYSDTGPGAILSVG